MDIVYIYDLRIDVLIGIYDWERSIKQQIRIDLEMGWDNTKPAASDDIVDTLNYKEAAQRIKKLAENSRFQLVETLAERIADMLLNEMNIPWLKLRLGKPYAVKDSSEVGVCIERHRKKDKAKVFLSIGSNINKEENIRSVMQHLQDDYPDIVFSNIYETEAYGFEGDSFYNLAAGIETDRSVHDIEFYLKNLEHLHARERNSEKFSPRTLDIDLLLYNDLILQPEKDLPRKEILKYPFVLFPLEEIAADVIHPELKISIAEIAKQSGLDRSGLKRVVL